MEYINKKLKEFNNSIKDKKIALIGLGISNIPLIDYLCKLGATLVLFNNKQVNNPNILELIEKYNLKLYTGDNYLSNLNGFDFIFRSPSCRPDIPEIEAEINRGAKLTSEIELVMELAPGTIIGITGSDGKTTTTTLIYEILKEANLNCFLGGNIGKPLFTQIENMRPEDYIVLELSSFQLLTMKKSPDIAVITNITPNHLDIHKSYQEYIDAKMNIFKYQNKNNLLILNHDNDITNKFKSNSNIVFFSSKEKLDNGYIVNGSILQKVENGKATDIINIKDIKLRGVHNYENICAAIAATKDIVTTNIQIKAISKFTGVNHRLEFIREIAGAKWYNDSIASSPTRTIAGLNSFTEPIILIAGGYDKHLDYTPLAKPIIDKTKALILLGQTSEKIYNAVKDQMYNEDLEIYKTKTLEEAITTARKVSKVGDIVLFSPASASFDMFKNFEERGNRFKELVNQLL